MPGKQGLTPQVRFEQYFVKGQGCWVWSGAGSPYGKFWFRGSYWSSHRVSWALYRGSIPRGALVCHKCDNAGCVNPKHLYLGDHFTNNQDTVRRKRNVPYNALKTLCKRGHPFDKANTYLFRSSRICKACHRIHLQRYARKKKNA